MNRPWRQVLPGPMPRAIPQPRGGAFLGSSIPGGAPRYPPATPKPGWVAAATFPRPTSGPCPSSGRHAQSRPRGVRGAAAPRSPEAILPRTGVLRPRHPRIGRAVRLCYAYALRGGGGERLYLSGHGSGRRIRHPGETAQSCAAQAPVSRSQPADAGPGVGPACQRRGRALRGQRPSSGRRPWRRIWRSDRAMSDCSAKPKSWAPAEASKTPGTPWGPNLFFLPTPIFMPISTWRPWPPPI